MHNKNIIFFTFFCMSSSLVGMEIKSTNIQTWCLSKTVIDDKGINSQHIDFPKELFKTKLYDKKIDITNLVTNESTTFHHNCWVTIAAVSPSGNLIATGSGTNQARLFDVKKNIQIVTFALNSSVSDLEFDPSEKNLAIAGDNKVHIFNIKTCNKAATLDHDKNIVSIRFDSSGNTLATESSDSTITLFVKK